MFKVYTVNCLLGIEKLLGLLPRPWYRNVKQFKSKLQVVHGPDRKQGRAFIDDKAFWRWKKQLHYAAKQCRSCTLCGFYMQMMWYIDLYSVWTTLLMNSRAQTVTVSGRVTVLDIHPSNKLRLRKDQTLHQHSEKTPELSCFFRLHVSYGATSCLLGTTRFKVFHVRTTSIQQIRLVRHREQRGSYLCNDLTLNDAPHLSKLDPTFTVATPKSPRTVNHMFLKQYYQFWSFTYSVLKGWNIIWWFQCDPQTDAILHWNVLICDLRLAMVDE